jgi:hypothetical protein
MGLQNLYVFYENASEKLLNLFPMRNYVGWLYDFDSKKRILVVGYIIPHDEIQEALLLLRQVVDAGLCSTYSVYLGNPSFTMNSPFHKVIDSHGIFHPEKNDVQEVKRQITKLECFLNVDRRCQLAESIKENPLIIPTIAEYMYELRSSLDIWNAIKSKLGESIWDYFPQFQNKKEGVGIKCIQNTMRSLHRCALINQMRVVYFPFEICHNLMVWTVIDFRDRNELVDFAEFALTNSVYIRFLPLEKQKTLIAALVSGESLQYFFEPLTHLRIERMFLFDTFGSFDIIYSTRYSIFDYPKIFDPVTCSWDYDFEAMRSEIEKNS